MNYKKIYNDLCSSRQKIRGINKKKLKKSGDNTYYEKHHIIPKSMNGTNEDSND